MEIQKRKKKSKLKHHKGIKYRLAKQKKQRIRKKRPKKKLKEITIMKKRLKKMETRRKEIKSSFNIYVAFITVVILNVFSFM